MTSNNRDKEDKARDLDKFKFLLEEENKLTAPKVDIPSDDKEEIDYIAVNLEYVKANLPPIRPVKRRRQRTFSVSDEALVGLEIIAGHYKLYTRHGPMSGSPSVSDLLDSIGLGVFQVVITRNEEPTPNT